MAEKENSFKKNYARDTKVADRFMDAVKGTMMQARINRRSKEELWLEDLRLWACNLTMSQMYQGRANVFVPELHHQIESTVSKYLASLFPNPDYLGIIPMRTTTRDTAEKIRAAVYNELEYKNNIQSAFEIHGRQRALFGTSPMRCTFVKDQTKIYAKVGKEVKAVEVPKFWGVKWEVVDVFRWYICPEWADMSNYYMVFEDDWIHKKTLEDAKDSDGKPMFTNINDIQPFSQYSDEHYWVDCERLEANNIGTYADLRPKQCFISTVHMDFDLVEGGDKVPVIAVIGNDGTLLRLARNQFWMQKANYVVGRYLRFPTRNFYGMSLSDRLRSLQYMINDTGNQSFDSLTYSLNPIAIVDPALAGDPQSFVLQPGAKWWGSPQGIDFANFSDVSGSGFNAMSQLRGMISQFSDSATAVAPQLQGKARSATQASVVDREVNQDMKISIVPEQLEVLEPMCQWTHALLKQYMSDSQQIRVQGPDYGSWIMDNVSPADLVGDVDFVWQGAQIADKTAIYRQQLMSFYQLAVQATSTIPQLQGKIDLVALFNRVAQEGFSLDRMDEILYDLKVKKTVSQEVENIAIVEGQDVPVHDGDNDDEHMLSIDRYLEEHKSLKTQAKLGLFKHREKHEIQKAAKAKLMQQEAEIKALEMSAQEGMQPGGQQPQAGRPFQIATGTSENGLMQGARGVEPL